MEKNKISEDAMIIMVAMISFAAIMITMIIMGVK